jgi:hypothetical protein
MGRKVDAFVSLLLALCVTILFMGQTITRWPEPFRLHEYQLELDNPFATFLRGGDKAGVHLANN